MSSKIRQTRGTLALVGGAEWRDGCSFDRTLIEESKDNVITLLPTAAAFEYPQRAVVSATDYFHSLGATVEAVMLLERRDAFDEVMIDRIRSSNFIYLSGGSPMHLRSVLKATPALDALVAAWKGGATLAGSSAGAMVLTDPMSDPRGGALTVGLGLVKNVAFVPHFDTWDKEKESRTVAIAARGDVVVAGVDERTALIRSAAGVWRVEGFGSARLFSNGENMELEELESRVTLI